MGTAVLEATKKDLPGEFFHTEKRLASADILKVLAIFSVVFLHGSYLIPYSPSAIDLSFEEFVLAEKVFQFCVPVFIFLWAYFLEKSVIKSGEGLLFHRFIRLLIPFLVWSLIYFLFFADFQDLSLIAIISKYWSGYGWSGQYFFIILFQLIIIFPVMRKISIRLSSALPVLFFVSFVFYILVAYSGVLNYEILNKLSTRPFFYWLPYMVLGIVHAHRNIFKISLPLIVGLGSVMLIPLEVYLFYLQDTTIKLQLLPSVFLATLLLTGSVMEAGICYSEMPVWPGKIVQLIARNTLGIFCLNPLVILILYGPMKESVNFKFPGGSVLVPVLSTVLIMAICLAIVIMLRRFKLGFLVSN